MTQQAAATDPNGRPELAARLRRRDDPRRRSGRGRRSGPARASSSTLAPGCIAPRRSGIGRSSSTCCDQKIPYIDDARAYEQTEVDAPGRQGGRSRTRPRGSSLVEGRRARRGRPADRDGQDAPGQPRHREGRAADPDRHADDRPDEPVVRRADARPSAPRSACSAAATTTSSR